MRKCFACYMEYWASSSSYYYVCCTYGYTNQVASNYQSLCYAYPSSLRRHWSACASGTCSSSPPSLPASLTIAVYDNTIHGTKQHHTLRNVDCFQALPFTMELVSVDNDTTISIALFLVTSFIITVFHSPLK